jgi:hypothetical protein
MAPLPPPTPAHPGASPPLCAAASGDGPGSDTVSVDKDAEIDAAMLSAWYVMRLRTAAA